MKSSNRISPGWIGASSLAGFDMGHLVMVDLVIIDELNIVCVSVSPGKADPPLVVYTNTVASRSVALQRFQPVTWRRAKVVKFSGVMQEQKLPPGDTLKRAKPIHGLISVQFRGVRTAKGAYQSSFYYAARITSNETRIRGFGGVGELCPPPSASTAPLGLDPSPATRFTRVCVCSSAVT